MLKSSSCFLLLEVARRIENAPNFYNPYRWDADIAAFICKVSGLEPIRAGAGHCHVDGIPVGETAADLIGVPFVGSPPRVHPLFFVQDWAQPYRAAIQQARFNEERATITAQYLRHFVRSR